MECTPYLEKHGPNLPFYEKQANGGQEIISPYIKQKLYFLNTVSPTMSRRLFSEKILKEKRLGSEGYKYTLNKSFSEP